MDTSRAATRTSACTIAGARPGAILYAAAAEWVSAIWPPAARLSTRSKVTRNRAIHNRVILNRVILNKVTRHQAVRSRVIPSRDTGRPHQVGARVVPKVLPKVLPQRPTQR